MRSKLLLPLIAIFVLSLVTVLGLGAKLAIDERTLIRAEYSELAEKGIREKKREIAAHFLSLNLSNTEADKSRLLAELFPLLLNSPNIIPSSRLVLVDEQGKVASDWAFTEDFRNYAPYKSILLEAPLEQFRLVLYIRNGTLDITLYGPALMTVIPAVFIVFSILFCLVLQTYRTHNRELLEKSLSEQFLGRVSHELRTPLTNIKMYAELLVYQADEGSTPEQNARIIVTEADRLGRLIDNVLSYQLTKASPLAMKRQECSLREIVQDVIGVCQLQLREQGFSIRASHKGEDLVCADKDALRQILLNLVSNVEKHARVGRYLSIRTRNFGNGCVLAVFDRGPGIPKAQRNKVFEAFYQGNEDTSTSVTRGVGLGLNIVRELVERHGGSIKIHSRLPGSVLTVRIPQ